MARVPATAALLATLLLWGAVGCHILAAYEQLPAGEPAADAPRGVDAARDLPTTSDGPPGGRDGPPPTGDGLVDAEPTPDTGPPPPRCASGCSETATYGTPVPTMVICRSSSKINQCGANNRCGKGWHLCTAGEYLKRGGAAKPAGTTLVPLEAWIQGCVRSGASPHAPTNNVCSCSSKQGTPARYCWRGSKLYGGPELHVGVLAHGRKHAVGVNTQATTAYWKAAPSTLATLYSMCCSGP